MNAEQYLKMLKRLKLTPSSKRTAEALGMSVRGIQALASGERGISGPIERLLAMYVKHGLPKEYRQ